MAVLTTAERLEVRALFNDANGSERGEITGLTKTDITAAIGGLDDYFNTNATAINTAIPQPARGALSVRQKALLVHYVIRKRYGV